LNETARRSQALSAQPVSARNFRIGAAFKQAPAELGYAVDDLLQRDPYLITVDYAASIACQATADPPNRDADGWTRKPRLNTARCGLFASKRAVRQYGEGIWMVDPLPVKP
jgi:glucan phosphorylase